jgi:hypothetical protein
MTRTVTPTVHPDLPATSVTPVIFSHPAADEPATRATDGGSVDEKARQVLFSARTTARPNSPQR